MKIDREQLASLLAERSGMDEDEVQSQLDTLLSRIRGAAEEGKSFEIEEFGTFRMEEDEIRFEPSRILRTEINQKYAGMKPIELIGAYKEQHGDVEDAQEDEENVIAAGESAGESGPSKSFALDTGQVGEDESAGEDEDSRRSRIKARAAKARREAARRSGEKEGEAEQDQKDKQAGEEAGKKEKKTKKEKPAAALESTAGKRTAGPRSRSRVKTSRDKRSGDSLGRIAAAMVIVIAVAAAGWMAWDAGLFDTRGPEAGESVQAPAEQDERPTLSREEQATGDQSAGGQESAGQTEQSGGEDVSTGEGEAPSTGYGLEGELNTALSSYYTIVVHSLGSRNTAENRAEDLRQQGYRVSVHTATVDGTQYWRVGLGQFSGVSEAQEAADGLPEPFRSEHFIRNIQ